MTLLISTLLLTVAWAALFATLDLRSMAFGALVSWAILAFVASLDEESGDAHVTILPRPVGILILTVAFARELIMSAWSVVREAWRPELSVRPGILAVPLEVETDLEITVLASLISLTPGTLSMEVTPDRKKLYVHALVINGDGEDVRQSIRERLERPVQRAFRVIPKNG